MAAISSGVTTGITAAIFLRCPTVEGPTTLLTLPDGRTLAADDVGAPGGRPVVYVHGTPDSRLARHPDDDLARRLGVRLVAVDRPGFGHSSPAPRRDGRLVRRGRGAAGRPPRPRPVRGARLVGRCGARAGDRRRGAPPGSAPSASRPGSYPDRPTRSRRCSPLPTSGSASWPRWRRRWASRRPRQSSPPTSCPIRPTLELAREQLRAGDDSVRLAELESVPGGARRDGRRR